MKLLVVAHNVPTLDTGAGKRNHYLLQALRRAHRVSLLTVADDSKQAAEAAATLGDLVEAVYITPALPGRFKRVYQIAGLLTRQPSIIWRFSTLGARRLLRRLLAEQGFDAVLFESVITAGHTLPPGVRMIVDEHNLEYELLERSAAQAPSRSHRLHYQVEAPMLKRAELRTLRRADLALVTSARERDIVLREAPGAHVEIIPNGVDSDDFAYSPTRAAVPGRVVFTGSFDYHPNELAALYFAEQCWPAVRAALPEASWQIVGRNPSPAVLALADLPGVTVTGSVPAIQPYLEEASVAVAPILVGSGTRLKILEALATGVPVVSTTVGYEGLTLRPGEDLLVADDAPGFAEAVIRLLRDDALRARLSAAGHAVVAREYEWRSVGDRLLATLAQLEAPANVEGGRDVVLADR